MKTCEPIQEKLVSGEPLTQEELDHIAACDDCRSFQETAREIARSAEAVRDLEGVPADEIETVQNHISSRIRPVRAAFRLAWASAAMLVGILGTVLVLSGVFGPDDNIRTEESFLTLLDEVNDITRPETEETSFNVSDTTLFSVALLYKEEITQESTELELPGAYQILEENLQEG
jgi:predicted anti-sigma-YlaC factor YlaD